MTTQSYEVEMINPILQVRKLSSNGLSNWPKVVNHGIRIQNEPALLTFIQPYQTVLCGRWRKWV